MTVVDETEYQKLINVLQHHRDTGNVLVVVIVDDLVLENNIIVKLIEDLDREFSLRSWMIVGSHPSISEYLIQDPPESDKPFILFVEGWRNLSSDDRDWAIDRLNRERDALRRFHCSFILFVPKDIAAMMTEKAGDFWSCITGPFEFNTVTAAAKKREREILRGNYFNYLRKTQGQLNFQGILPLKELISLPLPELFVPLRIRYKNMSAPPNFEQLRTAEQRETEPLDFSKLLYGKKRVVLLGDPGTGKTTLLSYLALALSGDPEEVEKRLGFEITQDKIRFPLLFPISAYSRMLRESPDIPLADYLPLYFKGRGQEGFKSLFDYELERGNCLVLLDGLDEVTVKGERWGVVGHIRDFIVQYPNNRFIITSRPAGYSQTYMGEQFAVITIVPFTKYEIEIFIKRWFNAFDKYGFGKEGRSPEDLLRAISYNPGVYELARTPLLLVIMILLYYYRSTRFPHRRIDLYSQCVEALIETWNWARSIADRPVMSHQFQFDRRYVTSILGPIAFWMHEQEPGTTLARSELERRIALWLQEREGLSEIRAKENASRFIETVSEQSGMLVERISGEYSFPHQTFEEFLAAEYIAWQQNANEIVCTRIDDPRWQEIIRLTVGLLQGERLENLLIEMLTTAEGGLERVRSLVLIGECLRDAGYGAIKAAVRAKILTALVNIINDATEKFENRRDVGGILGELGDPRLGEMVEIPVGTLVMGLSDEEIDAIIRQTEARPDLRRMLVLASPQPEVPINAFKIDRYLVTNWQYKQFMDIGGYQNKTYWSEEGWEWRLKVNPKPAYWDHDEFGIRKPNHPIVGVSWYEAEAFCNWRSAHILEETGEEHLYRLPTEAEWEWAARGGDRRWWPWGMTWEEDCANADRELFFTTPVGIYPKGASPFGVLDMAGNVLEWTADRFKLYSKESPQTTEVLRTVRGGSFDVSKWWVMTITRQALNCQERHGATGFRCVLIR